MASIVPPDILFGDELFDLAMSPTASIVATASITGELAVYVYNRKEALSCVLSSSLLPSFFLSSPFPLQQLSVQCCRKRISVQIARPHLGVSFMRLFD